MIGIPANNKISPEQVWQENFKLIRNSMDEQYGKKIMKNILAKFNYYFWMLLVGILL